MSFTFDLMFSLRLLRKSPAFTSLSIIVLAGGLAVSLFTFAFLYTFTSKPLPLPEQNSLYRAALTWHSESTGEQRYTPAYEAAAIREQNRVFAEHGVWQNKTVYISTGDNNIVTAAVRTTANLFQISRTQPLLGRTLEPQDSKQGQPAVAMISHSIWQNQFAGADDIIGRTFYVNDVKTEIVGVMPKGYRFPISHDLWLPIPERLLSPQLTDREKVELFGRLKEGVSEEQAKKQLYEIANDAFAQRENLWPGVQLIRSEVGLFQQFDVVPEMKLFALALNVIAFFVLLLAAVNIGNLLFARAIQRGKESAIREALGAPQWRLVSQLMWEGCIITIAGTLLAVAIVAWLLKVVNIYFHSLMGNELAFWYVWELDSASISAAVMFAVATIFIACFLPALKATRQDINMTLRDGTRGAQSRNVGRMSRFLVTMQIAAIAIIMVLGTVISMKVHKVTDMQLGYDVKGINFSIVDLPDNNYGEAEQQRRFFDKLQRDLDVNPDFVGAAARFNFRQQRVAIDGIEYATDADKPRMQVYGLIGNTEFLGPTLVEGRHFDARDSSDRALTALVSDSLQQRYWPNDTAIGKRVQVTLNEQNHWLTIVGVVSNTSNNPFEKLDAFDEVFVSGYQFPLDRGTVFFEKARPDVLVENEFFRVINGIDSQLDIITIEDWELEASSIGKMTLTFRDTIIFSGVFSMILAMSGIYGLTAFSVVKRSQEVGIRRALGATDANIIGLFVKQGGRQLAIGLLLGVSLSGLIMFGISSILGLTGGEYAAIFVSTIVVLSIIVLAAIIIPARQAVELQPSVALRNE